MQIIKKIILENFYNFYNSLSHLHKTTPKQARASKHDR